MIRVLLIWLALALPAVAVETIVTDLSRDQVSITADFQGSQIFIFGAVKRDAPVLEGAGDLDVIIEVAGPPSELTVRRKDKRFGIWVNTDTVQIDRAPSFYTIAATNPIRDILTDRERSARDLGLDYAVQAARESEDFRQAVIRIKQDEGNYADAETPVKLTEETLFTTEVALPANLIEGDYTATIYLVRNQQIISASSQVIQVRKAGLERWLYNMAQDQALLYGLMSIAVALIAGWIASEVFRLLRR